MVRTIAWSTSSWVCPVRFSAVLVESREWSPPSTTNSSLGARIFARVRSSSSSGQSGSRSPCTNKIGVESASSTASRSLPFWPTSG